MTPPIARMEKQLEGFVPANLRRAVADLAISELIRQGGDSLEFAIEAIKGDYYSTAGFGDMRITLRAAMWEPAPAKPKIPQNPYPGSSDFATIEVKVSWPSLVMWKPVHHLPRHHLAACTWLNEMIRRSPTARTLLKVHPHLTGAVFDGMIGSLVDGILDAPFNPEQPIQIHSFRFRYEPSRSTSRDHQFRLTAVCSTTKDEAMSFNTMLALPDSFYPASPSPAPWEWGWA